MIREQIQELADSIPKLKWKAYKDYEGARHGIRLTYKNLDVFTCRDAFFWRTGLIKNKGDSRIYLTGEEARLIYKLSHEKFSANIDAWIAKNEREDKEFLKNLGQQLK